MKFLLIIAFIITGSQVWAKTLVDCTPNGELLANNSMYVTYSIEQHDSEPDFLRLRKGYQTNSGESYVERLVPKIGFEYEQQEDIFRLSYVSMEGQIVIVGQLWDEITPQKQTVLADSMLRVMMLPSESPVQDIINSNEEIKAWTCQLKELNVLTSLKRPSPKDAQSPKPSSSN